MKVKVGDRVIMSRAGEKAFPRIKSKTGIVKEISGWSGTFRIKRDNITGHECQWWPMGYWRKMGQGEHFQVIKPQRRFRSVTPKEIHYTSIYFSGAGQLDEGELYTEPHPKLQRCHDCGAEPGEVHSNNCDVERCTVCGGQRLMCDCKGHDKLFARWTGIWPGSAEAAYLGIDLNTLAASGLNKLFFAKPR